MISKLVAIIFILNIETGMAKNPVATFFDESFHIYLVAGSGAILLLAIIIAVVVIMCVRKRRKKTLKEQSARNNRSYSELDKKEFANRARDDELVMEENVLYVGSSDCIDIVGRYESQSASTATTTSDCIDIVGRYESQSASTATTTVATDKRHKRVVTDEYAVVNKAKKGDKGRFQISQDDQKKSNKKGRAHVNEYTNVELT